MRMPTLFRSGLAVTALSLTACASCEDRPPPPPPPAAGDPRIALLTGSTGSTGNLDGPRDVALFAGPSSLAFAADGSLYVADTSNVVIRKIAPDGTVSTFAGRSGELGSDDGVGADARFLLPVAIVIDAEGFLFVSDTEASTIRRISPDGDVETWVGAAGEPGTTDGARAAARLVNPEGLALDKAGNLYVADRTAHTVRKVTPAGDVTTVVGLAGTPGSDDGDLATARLAGPFGVAVADDGTLAIADADNNVIRLVSPDGVVSTLAGTAGQPQSTTDGTGPDAGFGRPRALAFFPDGAAPEALLVADTFNDRVRHVTLDGAVVTTWAGSVFGFTDGTRETATLSFPSGFALREEDGELAVYVAEVGTSLIRRITDQKVERFAGRPAELGYLEGTALEARYFLVTDALGLDDGSTLLVDSVNNVIRRLGPDGAVEVFAGIPGEAGADDGPRREARFSAPSSIIADGKGGFFVSDQGNHTIRRIDADGQVTLFAGGPVGRGAQLLNGPLLDALFFAPSGLARDGDVDAGGALYVADSGNHAVRKISGGQVSTLAGDGLPGYLEGFGSDARFQLPTDVLLHAGALYVADHQNSVVRKVDLDSKEVTTFVGAPGANEEEPREGDADGTGAEASFRNPSSLLTDGQDILIADSNNSLIRRATPAGVVTTVAGTRGSLGIIEGGLPGSLFEPFSLARAADGSVLVTFATGALVIGPEGE